MAGATRLELATSGVTGRRSNQLNYAPALGKTLISERAWWAMTGLNRRPPACKAGALPTELIAPKTRGIITEGRLKSTAFLLFAQNEECPFRMRLEWNLTDTFIGLLKERWAEHLICMHKG
jgi:hypothetical protein